MSAPKVSVVAITYNQEKYIKQTLESFLMQKTDFEIEIIVADDCSNDKTPQIIAEYAKKYPNKFRAVLRKQNIGAVANSLDSLRMATGTYVALCEGDDYWTDPMKLQKQADFLDAHPECGLCFHPVQVVFENNEEKRFVIPDSKEKELFTTDELIKRNFIQTNAVMYRRQDYSKMPTEIMPLDWYLHLYHAQFGKIGFIDEVMAVYRRHPGGLWWESSYKNTDAILQKYGVEWLGLYVEVLRLYRKSKRNREILNGSIITMLNRLAAVDKKYDEHLLRKAIAKYPEAAEIFIFDLIKQAEMLDAHSKEQAKIIEHYANLSKNLQHVEAENKELKAKKLLRLERALKSKLKHIKKG